MTSKVFSADTTPRAGTWPGYRELARAGRFAVIGSVSVGIDFVLYRLLAGAGVSPHVAKTASGVCGITFGFLGNKFWTFGSHGRSLREPLVYLAVYTVTLGINVAVNAAVLAAVPDGTVTAFLAATAVSTILNYFGLRLLAFRGRPATPPPGR
jgi:putative flippase GtrA